LPVRPRDRRDPVSARDGARRHVRRKAARVRRADASWPQCALGDQRRRNGRAASVLTAAVLTALSERLKTPPDDGGRWTGPKVA
jgi:hypothetical protein